MKVLMTALLATAIQLSVTHAACAGENLAKIKSARHRASAKTSLLLMK